MKRKFVVISVILLVVLMSMTFLSCNEEEDLIKVGKCFYDGIKLTWEELQANVVTYDVSVNGQVKATGLSTCEYEYDSESDEKMEVVITSHYMDWDDEKSSESSVTTFTCKGAFTYPDLSHGVISWEEVEGASGYSVKVGTAPATVITDTKYELDTGADSVRVKPVMTSESVYYHYSAPRNYDIVSAPTLFFEKTTKTVSWNTVSDGSGFLVQILKKGGTVIKEANLGKEATKYADYDFKEAGTYILRISTNGDQSKNKDDSKFSEYEIIRLAAPVFQEVKEGDNVVLVHWSKVENAVFYRVSLPGGGSAQNTSELVVSYPLSAAQQVEQELKFEVISCSNLPNVLNSEESMKTSVTRLGVVKNVKNQNGFLTWDSVSKAQSYVVSIDGKEIPVSNTQYALNVEEGSHAVKVKAAGNGKETISSTYSNEQQLVKLSTPRNVHIENGILSWDLVSGCSSYIVYFDNGTNPRTVSQSNTTIMRSDIKTSCTVYIVAKGNGELVIDSNGSETKQMYLLNIPTIYVGEEGIEWDQVENAVSYSVSVDDNSRNVTGTSFSLSDFKAASYVITVTAIGDNSTFFDSESSIATNVKKLSEPVISVDEQGLHWETVSNAQAYEVRFDGEATETFSAELRSKTDLVFKTPGKHTVEVRAKGDCKNYVASSWSAKTHEVQSLPKPTNLTFSKENNQLIIRVDEIENASGYEYIIGGTSNISTSNSFFYNIPNAGDIVIRVRTKGDNIFYLDSVPTSDTVVTQLATPETSAIKFNRQDSTLYTVEWTPIQNAVAYRITVKKYRNEGDTDPAETPGTADINYTNVEIGVEGYTRIEVEITALGNGTTIFNSETIKVSKKIY